MYRQRLNWNSFPILELSVKFVSQIYHENINKLLDGTYLADFGLDITQIQSFAEGVSKTTKHKVLDLKQLKQSYSVVIQSKLLDIFRESHIWYFAHKIFGSTKISRPWSDLKSRAGMLV